MIDCNKLIEDIEHAKAMMIKMGINDPVVYINQKTFDELKQKHVEVATTDPETLCGMPIGIMDVNGMVFLIESKKSKNPWGGAERRKSEVR